MKTAPEAHDATPHQLPAAEADAAPAKRVRIKTAVRAGEMTPVRNLRG
jgi:hypothetical protein